MQIIYTKVRGTTRGLVKTNQDHQSASYLNPTIVFILMAMQRTSLLFPLDKFADSYYKDQKLELLRDIIHWSTHSKAIDIIQSEMLELFLFYLIIFGHTMMTICICFADYPNRLVALLIRHYFSYLKALIIVPSILIIGSQQHNYNSIIIVLAMIPIVVNYIISVFVFRNYTIPVCNPFHKRYNIYNYIIALLDISSLISHFLVSEILFAYFMLIYMIFSYFDAFVMHPYAIQINSLYANCVAVILQATILKLVAFYFDQLHIIYFFLFYIPLGTYISNKCLWILQGAQISQPSLGLGQLVKIMDLLLSYEPNSIEYQILVTQIKQQYHLKQLNKSKNAAQDYIGKLFYFMINEGQILNKLTIYRGNSEDLYLYNVFYLMNYCGKPLLGYIALKSLEAKSEKQSSYFQIMSEILQGNIAQTQITGSKVDQSDKLQVTDIRRSEILAESCVQQVVVILDTKLRFWASLQKGYARIEQFAESATFLSQLIWKIREQVFEEINLHPLLLAKEINKFNTMQLKILSMLYSAVLNDYHSTFETEQRYEEIMAVERNLQTEDIINSTVMKDEIFLIMVSIIKNRGAILNTNRSSMAQFFGYDGPQDFINISCIDQLMPAYVSSEHNALITQYLKRGSSKLFDSANEVYFKLKSGHIQCAKLCLTHIFEKVNDYVITGALQKSKAGQEFIVFDQDGRIQGISNGVFHSLIDPEIMDLDIMNQCYIYFWFHSIFQIIQSEKLELQKSENQYRTASKSCYIYPLKSVYQILKEHTVFRKQNHWMDSQMDLSRVNQSEMNEKSMLLKTEDQDNQLLGCNVRLLRQQSRDNASEFMNRMVQQKLVHQDIVIQMRFTIGFNTIGQNKKPVFVIQVQETLKKQSKAGSTFANTFATQSLHQSQGVSVKFTPQESEIDEFDESQFQFITEDEQQVKLDFNVPVRNRLMDDFEVSSFRKRIDDHPQVHQAVESQLISPRNNEDVLIKQNIADEDQEQEDDDQKYHEANIDQGKSSSKQAPKQDVVQILFENKQLNENNNDNVNKSQTSATSDRTQNSIFNILRNLQYNRRYQAPIVNAIINTFMLFSCLLILVTVELVLIRANTDTLQTQIPLVRLPDKFNRLYCTFTTIGQYDVMADLLKLDYGKYYDYRKITEANIIRDDMLDVIKYLKNSFSELDNQGKIPNVNVRIINAFVLQTKITSFIQFNQMVNEHTQMINYFLTSNKTLDRQQQQIEIQFLKGNLNAQLTIASELVNQIVIEFFQNIDDYQILYMIFMFIQLSLIFTFLVMQIKLWKSPYLYQQNILLLISRVSEKDIETLVLKYRLFKDKLLENANRWKSINYFKDMYNFRMSELRKMQKTVQQSVQGSSNAKQATRNKQSSRIQETQFSLVQLFVMIFLLWALLSAYVISAYTFQFSASSASRPEMELCMTFVKFKSNFDGMMILSQLLKNQQLLIDVTMANNVFSRNPELSTRDKYFKTLYDEMLAQFVTTSTNAFNDYALVYDRIVASLKMSDTNKQLLLGLYESDICIYGLQDIPFCDYKDGKFAYFPDYPSPRDIDNNRDTLKYGINGIVNEVKSILNTYYASELTGEKDSDFSSVTKYLESPSYLQVIFPYFFDLNKAIVLFYSTILQTSLDILEQDYQNTLIYYCAFGIVSIVILFITIAWRSYTLQQQIRAIRQTLVVLPHESLMDPQTYNAIKRIERNV